MASSQLPPRNRCMENEGNQALISSDQGSQPVKRHHQDAARLCHHGRSELALACQQGQLANELAWTSGGEVPLDARLVVDDPDPARHDHEEFVAAVSLPEQHLACDRRADLSMTTQLRYLLLAKRAYGAQGRAG